MSVERPDLSQVDPSVVAYIEALEAELATLREDDAGVAETQPASEPPTPCNLVTVSASGFLKRTARHHYARQRRGGMGVFDLQTTDEDKPSFLTLVDAEDAVLLFTSLGRAFRLPLAAFPEAVVRARGESVASKINLLADEELVAILPASGEGCLNLPGVYVTLVSERGWVRRIRGSYLGPKMIPGTTFHNIKEGGPLAAAAWTPADGDLFIATRQGQAIRFNGAQVPTRGCLGVRVTPGDAVIAVAGVDESSGVFLLGSDGKGTVRLMSGFRTNKSPGASGKVAMKTDCLVGALTVAETDDLFIISRLSKVIRFPAGEVPPKEGVVQGVNCITLRADEAVAVTAAPLATKEPMAGLNEESLSEDVE